MYMQEARQYSVKLKKRAFIRNEVEFVHDKLDENANVVRVNVTPVKLIKLIPEEIELRLKPVPDKPEMMCILQSQVATSRQLRVTFQRLRPIFSFCQLQ